MSRLIAVHNMYRAQKEGHSNQNKLAKEKYLDSTVIVPSPFNRKVSRVLYLGVIVDDAVCLLIFFFNLDKSALFSYLPKMVLAAFRSPPAQASSRL